MDSKNGEKDLGEGLRGSIGGTEERTERQEVTKEKKLGDMGVKSGLKMINPCFTALMERGTVLYIVYNKSSNSTQLPEFRRRTIICDSKNLSYKVQIILSFNNFSMYILCVLGAK